ncbi:BapA prefix-like domain-containing protein [Acinetobacter cumulans]|uniref:BapA prefix-like domain-containing protein n=2 Tax=Acinetobacter cumulans TaxID=2136182 RepID=A0A3A8GCT8_9GAMM|nr:BapA/Bap/LapF family large adhesin [Acinetobacter cumulans]RKG55806.1 BapA prefix-like domain-containing protein [Acinetobacter cumulans]
MTQISVISKESHQVLEQVDSNRVGLTQNSVVVVKVPKEDVASITRDGNNAVITLKSGETIVIENYFAGDKPDNSLVFESDDGGLFWAKFTDANGAIADVIQYQPLAEIEPLLYKDSLVGAILPWALGAAGVGAVGAAVNNGSSNNNDGTPSPVKKLSTLVVTDNVEPKTGQLTAGSATNDKTPVVSGTGAEPGATIKVYDGNQLVAETVAKADGSWSVKLPKELTDGEHSISATQTVDGVEGPKSDALNFTVDTQDPTVSINDLGDTNDTTPTISGKTNEPKAEIDVVIKDKNGNVVDSGKANVDDQGNWNYTPSKPLPEGDYKVEVTAKDPAGNESTQDKGGLVVDTTDPTITIDPLKPTGDSTPTITGKTDPDASVDVVIKDKDGNIVDSGKGTVDGNGDWTYTPSKPLPEGPYEVEVTAKDPAGNDKTVTDKGLDVDSSLPVISIDPLKPTNDTTPTVTGKTEPGATVTVEVKDSTGKVVDSGPATVDSNGNWSYIPSTTLLDGAYTVDATAKDAAGNPSTATDKGLSVDTQAPTISINPLAPTNDTTPTVSGKTEAGATVNVEIKDATGKVVESGPATVDSNGNWSYTPSTTLPDGAYTVDATAKDAAGNPATATDKGLAVDTQAPTISINPLAPTNDNTPTISGKTEPGATVNVEIKDPTGKVVESGPATVDGNGNWSYTPANPLPEGPYTVDATAKDPAGNPSTATEQGLDVNTSALTVSIDPLKPTQDTTPDISGKTAVGATVTVEVKDSTGKVVATGPATVDSNGNWTFTPSTALAEGNYTVAVEAVNAANTIANATATGLIVDTTLPAVTIDHLVLTNDATPTVKGTTEKGATVTVEVKDSTGKVVDSGPATVDANGNWTYTPSKTLPDGAYTVDATAKDAAGNPATATDKGLVVDTTPPTVTIDVLGLTNATSPIIKGTAEAGATVTVEVKDAAGNVIDSGNAQVDGSGNWTFTPNKPLADGSYKVEATAKDAAGNPDIAIDTGLKIDTVPPTVDIDNLFGAASARMLMSVASTTSASLPQTNQVKPTFSGNSTKSVEVMIYLQDESGKNIDSGLAKLDTATGKWTYTPSHDLAEGYYMLQAISKDAAGNQSAPAAKAFIVDTQAPVVEVDDVGLTNDATPDVKGKVNEPTSTVTVKVADATGKVIETGIATVASDGKWSYTVKTSLTDGDYVVSATAKDKAGNTSAEDSATAKIDTAAPTSTLTVSPTGEVVITFSEAVKGFDKSDVTVNGGTLLNLTQQADGSWKGQVVANGTTGASGKVDVIIADSSYTDTAGNAGKGSSVLGTDVVSVDTTPPAATIVISPAGDVTISFSEPVKGFDASDVKVTGGTLQGLTLQADGTWTGHVVANGNTGASANVDLTIPAGSYTDLANNPGTAATQSQSVPSIDTTAPTPTITLTPAGEVTISFSEPVKGFDATDVKVTGGKLVSLTEQPDGTWTGQVAANGATGAPGNVVVSIGAGSYTDVANNPGNGGFAIENVPSIDTTAPTSTVTLDANGNLKITFSETVKGFDASDVKVTGGTVSGLTQQADGSWTGKVVADGNTGASGLVTVTVADNSFTDLAGNNGIGSKAENISVPSVDTTAPTATIVITPAGEVTITFSEPVKDFTQSDLVVAGGSVTGLVQQPDGTWKGQVVSNDPTGAPGQVDITIPAGSYTDNAGNPGQPATASQSVPGFDTTAPTSTMTLDANGNLKITFSEAIKGFDASDVKVTGGTVSGLTQQADGSWTAKVAADGNTGAPGLVTVTVADNSYTDLAGNNGKGSKVENISVPSIDTTAPTSTTTLDANGNLKITFSETVKGFDASDVKVTGGTVSGLTQQADGSWTGKVVADGNTGAPGLVTVTVADNSFTDLAGNNGIGSKAENISVPSVDTTAPTATIVITPAGEVTITFSEPVKGFDPTDVKVTGGTVSGLTQQPDGSWTGKVVADGNTGAVGKVDLTIPAGSYTDNAGNPGTVANQSQSVPSIDTTAPTSTVTLDANGNLKITFSETVKGFDASDVKVTGGTVSGLTQQADGSWTGKVVADGNTGALGAVTVSVADNSYTDLAGNNGKGNSASNNIASVDTTAPTAAIVITPAGEVTITFSEPVKDFTASDLVVAGGTVSGLTQQPDGTWKGQVVSNDPVGAPGKVDISIPAGSYSDIAGNPGQLATGSQTVPGFDTTAPTSTTTLDANGNLKISFSETVKGFDASDVKVTGGTVSGLTQQADGSWTGKVVADGNTGASGLVTVTVADNSFTDLAGNNGIGSKADNISVPSIDTTAPSVTVSFDVNGVTVINFSEPVTGFDASDITVAGGILNNLVQVSETQWTAQIKVSGSAAVQTVEVSIGNGTYTDKAGNAGTGTTVKGDITLPTVEIDPFDFFAAPAAAPVMKFAARALLAAEPLPPATNNPKQTFNGSSVNSVEVKINIYDSSDKIVESGLATLNTSTGRWSFTPSKPLADGQFRLEAISKDAYGVTSAPANIKFIVDTVKPTIDIDDSGVVSDATPSFSGKTEANATVTVTVKDAAGKVLASGAAVVAADGSWTYTAPNLADGTYKVEAVAKDRAGNLSDPDSTNVTVDTVAQLDALTVTANPDGTATITGKSEPGATVTVKDPNGNDLKVTVNPDGTFSAVAAAPAAEGTYTATAKDTAGNTATSTAVLDDNVAPVVTVDVTPNADGTASITGKTEPGATVTVKDPAGNNVPVTVNPDGTYTATVPAPAAEGTYTATATDKAGNVGTGTDVLVDNVAPTIVSLDVTPNADGTASITGKTEPGATVTVKDPAGNNVPVTVNPDGTFTATVPAPAAEGTYTATATDKAGNTGTATDVLDDNIGPQVTVDITPNADGTASITGKTEPGATVTVKDPAGNNVPVTVNPDGTYTATVPAPAAEGTYTVTATDKAGNPSTATDVLDDNVAPVVSIDVVSNSDGTATVTGKTEAGATVTVKDPAGNNVPVTVNPDGTYTATVPATAAEGTYTATATDKAGNVGSATDALVDSSVPSILTAQVDSQTGAFVTGKAQPGSSITVYTEDGKTVLGTGTVDASGQYSVTLNPAQVDGETVKVTAKDPGGESAPVTAAAPDLYAPDAPTAQVATDGKSVTGVTEPNAIVQVYGGSKGTTVIGTAVAGADGKYTVPLNPALVDGEAVKVTAKDPGGESLATPATAPDLYAPAAPTATINAKGDTVTGTAEANSVIKVYAPDGKTVIAQGNSDANGNYSIKLPTSYTDGQTLLVSASDAGGESGKTGSKAPNITVDAVDNLVDAGINFEYPVLATRTSELFNKFVGFNIGEKTFTGGFVVGDNEVANATITVTTKSLINLFDQAEMKLYKVVNGVDVLVGTNKDAGLFDLLGIFGESTQIQVKNLLPGEYKFAFSGGSLIGVGTSISAGLSLQVFDTAKDPVVSGVTNKSGNVITDADGIYGKDNVPAGTTVTTVNGKAVNASGTTVITGDHGTLIIAKDGSYTYKPTENVTNIGKSEVFSYTVTDPVTGKSDTASLIIHIGTAGDLAVKWDAANPKNDATTVVATDNTDTIGVQATNAVSVGAAKSISYSWLIGLFGVAIGKTSGSTDITVAKGTIENVNINFGSAQLVSLLGSTSVNVKDTTGKIVASTNAGTLVDVIGILPNGNSLSIPGLKAGTYTIEIVTNSGLVSVGGSVNASITRSVIDLDDFTAKSLATKTTGNLLTDNDGHGVDVLASKYTDLYISKDGGQTYTAVTTTGVTVKGAHGDLNIKADGSYTYSVTDSAFKVGTGDQFTYKLVAPNGDVSVAHLNVEIGFEYNTSIGNDVITSSVGNDVYTTNAGADTVIFKLLNTAEATGGNGHDTWTDFKKADGDKIDISALLQGQNVTASNIGNYVSVAKDGHGNTIISIDRDGQGSTFNGKTELLTLKNTDVTLQELLDNNHLIYH